MKKKKSDRARLIKLLDEASKAVIRQRDGNTCQHCGKWVEGSNRHVSHVIPVSAGSKLRWDLLNMKILCYHCHLNFWHKNPLEAAQWFRETFPERAAYLEANRGIAKFTIVELEGLLASLKAQLIP